MEYTPTRRNLLSLEKYGWSFCICVGFARYQSQLKIQMSQFQLSVDAAALWNQSGIVSEQTLKLISQFFSIT